MNYIKIIDTLFAHAKFSTDYQTSKYITWIRDNSYISDTVFYTDSSLYKVDTNIKSKYGWLLESPGISSGHHNWISNNYDKFDCIFTNSKKLLDISDKFKFAPTGGCWIKPEDQKIYNKTKLISTITSYKKFLPGHYIRHDIISKFNDKIYVYGRGHNQIEYKLTGLKDFMFSFAIENIREDYYFTEKLIDCFMTGTIPIFWGCPSIGKFFNEKGMIIFDKVDNLNINELNYGKYISMLDYIKENFEKAKEYLIAEDYIWEKYFK